MRARGFLLHFWRTTEGAAAAEMALVTPLLITMGYGVFEVGAFFFNEHVVVTAVRDGARFAGRQSFANMPCGSTSSVEGQIQNLVRFGNTAGTGNPRLSYWTSNSTITVTTACDTTGSYASTGVFSGMTGGARRVTVAATVPYQPILSSFGFSLSGFRLVAQSQAVVAGI